MVDLEAGRRYARGIDRAVVFEGGGTRHQQCGYVKHHDSLAVPCGSTAPHYGKSVLPSDEAGHDVAEAEGERLLELFVGT